MKRVYVVHPKGDYCGGNLLVAAKSPVHAKKLVVEYWKDHFSFFESDYDNRYIDPVIFGGLKFDGNYGVILNTEYRE